ncbi:Hypothetical predicted protein [Xyrichtys novacula]|uniref:Uncharacterized protein n=1 Tax=Xyrichtys novacula TaxID=13765 RepID=A0AAV1GKE0_XYRNO|nr:Hypothetical predicted protein [Xyrichtys novacula]
MRQELSIFAKRFSQSLSVKLHRSHRQQQRRRHRRGFNEMPRAISMYAREGQQMQQHVQSPGTTPLPSTRPSSEFHQRSGTGPKPRPPPVGRAGWVTHVVNHLYYGL